MPKTKCNELSVEILSSKYYMDGEETPEDVFLRVAKAVAIPDVVDRFTDKTKMVVPHDFVDEFGDMKQICLRVLQRRDIGISGKILAEWDGEWKDMPLVGAAWEAKYMPYYDAMRNLELMPGTPTLINGGRKDGMLSSCFFLRVPDSMEGIMNTNTQVALISKAGGGVGLDISDLRPKGTPVGTTAKGTSSGPVSFLKIFNETGNQVQQGGVRRAALIAIMTIDHPDVIEFIRCKEEEGVLTNFNISVLVTDEFMQAVNERPDFLWYTTWGDKRYVIRKDTNSPVEANPKHETIQGDFYTVKEIWDLIVQKAWSNGEPGVIFWDELNRGDVFRNKFGKLGVNPCGEQPLLPYESCNLAAVNLGECWITNESGEVKTDFEKISRLTRLGVRFLDNIIDINHFPLREIENWTCKTRRIGLGTMGLHDLMLRKGIRYGSEESLALIDRVYGRMQEVADKTSQELMQKRGAPPEVSDAVQRRNSGLLTVQPTGTVSIICNQTSSGVEPVFQWEFTRKDSYGTHQIQHFIKEKYPDGNLPDFAVTALEVTPEEHVRVQAQVQKYIDSSISKTVNLPNTATREDVASIFNLAHKTKCKSVTIYRSGSRNTEVLIKDPEKANEEEPAKPARASIITRLRGRVMFGATFKINTPGGKAYITVNEDESGIREVFIHISKAGSEIGTHVEAEGRLISHSLKHGIPAETIIGHMAGHKSNPIFDSGRSVKSVPDAVAIVMQEFQDNYLGFSEYIDKEPRNPQEKKSGEVIGELCGEMCPNCGEVMYMASGCSECTCGYSHCG